MKHAVIASISTIRTGLYEVTFQTEGAQIVAQFAIVIVEGVRSALPTPDIFMRGVVAYPRDVCAAVLAFDHARLEEEHFNETQS